MTSLPAHALYICYFGLREPLVQTQVLPYLREVRKGGIEISILTFETEPRRNWSEAQIIEERSRLESEGIRWHFLTYHKRPSVPATIFDICCGVIRIRALVKKEKIGLLHARSHVAAMMGALAKSFSFSARPKLLFDIRGFFPEEYVDAGVWKPDGSIFRAVKRAEKWLLRKSDGFVVLTERAREILFPGSAENGSDPAGRPVEVIPCCVDLSRFEAANGEMRRKTRARLGLGDRPTAVYVGSFGGWYLTEETANALAEFRKRQPDAFAMILTQTDPSVIEPLLRERGFGEGDYLVSKVLPAEIPNYLCAADIAISFIKPCYSKLASSPTKNAEYLACGLPILANDGIGDTTEMTRDDNTGVIVNGFESDELDAALEAIESLRANDKALAERSRTSAAKRFDLVTVGGESYRRIYRRLLRGE